jgi:hypothetical protein
MPPFSLLRPATAADGFIDRKEYGPDSPQSGWPRCTRGGTGESKKPATIERIGWPTPLLGGFRLSADFVGIGITRLFGGLFADFRGVGGFLRFSGYNVNGFYCFFGHD